MHAHLEHANITVSDPLKTAEFLIDLFGWKIRWQGEALGNGFTVHVGSDSAYLALYRPPNGTEPSAQRHGPAGGLNHIGIVVKDLDAAQAAVEKAGFTPHSHADYEPGRRFYFDGPDEVEYELVCYD